jgi:hypothetical protein
LRTPRRLLKVLNTRLGEAMFPEDGNRLVEDIFPGEQFSSSHCNFIGRFDLRGLHIQDRMVHYDKESEIVPEDPCRPAVNNRVIDLLTSLETKDPVPLAYVNPNKYIQHNLSSKSSLCLRTRMA